MLTPTILFSVMARCSALTYYHTLQKSPFGARFVRFLTTHSGLPLTIFKFLVGTLALGLVLFIFLSCLRTRKAAIYHVEANQINGPSLRPTFDPETATFSAAYPSRGPQIVISPAPPGRGTPRSSHFATAQQENLAREIVQGWPRPPQTAPVSKVNPYPFPGYSPVSCHLLICAARTEVANACGVIVFRRHLCNSHTLHFKVGSLGRCMRENLYKKRVV
jgi:hypothetical protein